MTDEERERYNALAVALTKAEAEVATLRAENNKMREYITSDYESYDTCHPHALDLLARYSWLGKETA